MQSNLPKKNDVLAFQERAAADPIKFSEEVLGPELWEKEKDILLSVKEHKVTAVRSCNASGKSFSAARVVNWWLISHVDSVVITTAPTWKQVKEILWREIKNSVAGKGIYPRDAVLQTEIHLRDKWFALGISTNKPDQFQGFHSEHLLVVIDEASGVSDEIRQAIDGLTPERILIIGNPLRNTGSFAQAFKDPGVHKIHISAFDTPNVKEGRVVIPGLITKEDVEGFRVKYGEESDVYRVRILGEFPKAEADSWIGLDEIESAMNRDPQTRFTEKIMGVDTARFGDDRTVFQIRQGDDYQKKFVFIKTDAPQLAGEIIRIAKEEKIRDINIKVDVVGTNGLSVVHLLKAEGWNVSEVNFAESAENTGTEEKYANLRAECYAHVKGSLKSGSLPKDEDYWELANIKFTYNRNGQILLERKEDMKKRGLPSPDVADAMAISWAPMRTRMHQTQSGSGYKPLFPEMGGY
jgi:phage terminase large subunit